MVSDGVYDQIAQATSKQMSKRDPLRPYMNIIDDMLFQMVVILVLYSVS
jgi:hypothetical protein